MISNRQWSQLTILDPGDFEFPEGLEYSILSALDRFSVSLGTAPVVLSDYRPGDPKQHGLGRAIDVTYPGLEPLSVWDSANDSGLFSGVGIYLNDAGAVSFHFDTRADRSPDNPARWGAFIRDHGHNHYVGAGVVIDAIKKKGWLALPFIGLAIWLLWRGRN